MSDSMADFIGQTRLVELMERDRDMRRARRADDDDSEMRRLAKRLRRLAEEQETIRAAIRRLRARRGDEEDDVVLGDGDGDDEEMDDDDSDSMQAGEDDGGYDEDELYTGVMEKYKSEGQVNRSPGSDDTETDFEMRRARRATLPKYIVSRTSAPVVGKKLVDAAKREARDEGLNWRSLPDRELAFRLALERA